MKLKWLDIKEDARGGGKQGKVVSSSFAKTVKFNDDLVGGSMRFFFYCFYSGSVCLEIYLMKL